MTARDRAREGTFLALAAWQSSPPGAFDAFRSHVTGRLEAGEQTLLAEIAQHGAKAHALTVEAAAVLNGGQAS